MRAAWAGLLAFMALVGCSTTRNFPMLGSVTTVVVVGRNGSQPLSKITDARSILQIVAFVDGHRTSWGTPWYGIPVSFVTAQFFNGSEFKGSFGVGQNFLETQRNGGFYAQRASLEEIQNFLNLLGINPLGLQKTQ